MNAKTFLEVLAAIMPGKPTPARTASLKQLAPRLRMDVPEERLTRDLADVIAPAFRDVPAYGDLLRAIQTAAPPLAHGDGSPLQGAEEPSGESVATYVAMFERRRAAGVDLTTLLSIARRYYPTRAWYVLRAKYAEHIERRARHLDDRQAPITPEERAARWEEFRAKRLLAVAPPPKGPTGQRAVVAAPEPGLKRADVQPEVLEQLRMSVGMPPAIERTEGT